jgi:pimeloyl-ACP methyl ester carboxylesterase
MWRQEGEGPTALIFIHGWCYDQRAWRHQMTALSDRFRCISLDLAGHGGTSSVGTADALTIAEMAADVLALREALELDRVILVGHSMGGAVAVEAAIASAEGVLGVIGVDSLTDERMYAKRPHDEIENRLMPLRDDFKGAVAGLVRMITLIDRNNAGVVKELVDTMTSAPPIVALASMRSLLEWDIDARWPLLTVPAWAINSSALVPLIAELPPRKNLKLRMLDEVGHFPMLENPGAFNVDLVRTLKDVLDS